eukprot:scaffold6753_cov36-Cyclotella_meneghiniana.AAC.1
MASSSEPTSTATAIHPPSLTIISPPHLRPHRTVSIASRTWPGINKPGGIGRITQIHTAVVTFNNDHALKVTHVDVKYILGGSEKRVDVGYVSHAPDYDDDTLYSTDGRIWSLRDHSKQLGRCTRCHSLRIDCHSCDWRLIEEEKNQVQVVVDGATIHNDNTAATAAAVLGEGNNDRETNKDYDLLLDSEAEDELANDILKKYKRLTNKRRQRGRSTTRRRSKNTAELKNGATKMIQHASAEAEEQQRQQREEESSEDDIPLALLEKRNAQRQMKQQKQHHENKKKRRRLINTCSLALLPDASVNNNNTSAIGSNSNTSSITRKADNGVSASESQTDDVEMNDDMIIVGNSAHKTDSINEYDNLESLSTTNNTNPFLFQEEIPPNKSNNDNHLNSNTQEELLLTPRPLDEDGNYHDDTQQEKLLTPKPLDENGNLLPTAKSFNGEESSSYGDGGGNHDNNDEAVSFQGDPDDISSTDDDDDDQVLNTLAPSSSSIYHSTADESDDYSIYSEESYEYYNDFFDEEDTTITASAIDQTPSEYMDLLDFIDRLASDIED